MKTLFPNKKGDTGTDSAIIQTFYTALGIIVFISLIQILYTYLNLDTQTNEDITSQNAKSIFDFYEHSKQNIPTDIKECYSLLKINNLENYQDSINDEKQTYRIIISENGIFKMSTKQDFEPKTFSPKSSNRITLAGTKLSEQKIILTKDTTDQGGIAGFDTTIDLLITEIGNGDNTVKTDKDIKYIVIEPLNSGEFDIFSSSSIYREYESFLDNTNRYYIRVYDKENDFESIYSKYLVYNNFDKSLFVSNGDITDVLTKSNLCSYKTYRQKILFDKYKENLAFQVPHDKYQITFVPQLSGEDFKYKFIWKGGGICYENDKEFDCNDLINEDYDAENLHDYSDFTYVIESYVIDELRNSPNEGSLKWEVDLKKLTQKEIDDIYKKYEYEIRYSDVFSNFQRFNTLEELENEKNEYDIDDGLLTNGFVNVELNSCDEEICDKIYIENQKVNFYLENDLMSTTKKFTQFNEQFIKKTLVNQNGNTLKEKYQFRFNNQIIPNDKIIETISDGVVLYTFKELYVLNNYQYFYFDAVISGSQMRGILE